LNVNPNHLHDFDPISGWCTRAAEGDPTFCGHRKDGRQIMPYSAELIHPGPRYTDEHMRAFKAFSEPLEAERDKPCTCHPHSEHPSDADAPKALAEPPRNIEAA
jgi:hypothetical protein